MIRTQTSNLRKKNKIKDKYWRPKNQNFDSRLADFWHSDNSVEKTDQMYNLPVSARKSNPKKSDKIKIPRNSNQSNQGPAGCEHQSNGSNYKSKKPYHCLNCDGPNFSSTRLLNNGNAKFSLSDRIFYQGHPTYSQACNSVLYSDTNINDEYIKRYQTTNNIKPGVGWRDSSGSKERKVRENLGVKRRGKKVQFDGGSYYDEGLCSEDVGGRISGRFTDESGHQYRFFGSAEKKN